MPLLFIFSHCLFISSAPNYCDTMGNKGAFITLTGGKLEPQYTTYEGSLSFPYFSSDLIQNLIYTNNLFQLWPTPMWSRWPTRTPCSACLDSEHSLIYTSPCPPWIQNCEVEQLLNLAILLWSKFSWTPQWIISNCERHRRLNYIRTVQCHRVLPTR